MITSREYYEAFCKPFSNEQLIERIVELDSEMELWRDRYIRLKTKYDNENNPF